jgi:tRNA-dihydrouridine synthase B
MAALTGRSVPADPDLAQQHALVREHHAMMIELYGPVIGVNLARKHLGWYTKGLTDSGNFRNAVNQVADPAAVTAMIDRFYESRMRVEALAA